MRLAKCDWRSRSRVGRRRGCCRGCRSNCRIQAAWNSGAEKGDERVQQPLRSILSPRRFGRRAVAISTPTPRCHAPRSAPSALRGSPSRGRQYRCPGRRYRSSCRQRRPDRPRCPRDAAAPTGGDRRQVDRSGCRHSWHRRRPRPACTGADGRVRREPVRRASVERKQPCLGAHFHRHVREHDPVVHIERRHAGAGELQCQIVGPARRAARPWSGRRLSPRRRPAVCPSARCAACRSNT